MTGVYLKCDECGSELGVESVPALKNINPTWGNKRELQEYAREIGWTGPLDHHWSTPTPERGKDLCPTCALNPRDASGDGQ